MTAKSKLHLLKNKWPNECYKCYKVIEPGEYVFWHHETKKVRHQDQSVCYYRPAKDINLSEVPFQLIEVMVNTHSPKRWQFESVGIAYPPPQGWKKAIKKEYAKRLEMQALGIQP